MQNKLIVKGATEHNLKSVDVQIPLYKLVVFTGVSGCGKSSLAFDTIFAEGQRRYLESLSSYARQFMGLKNKPAVESITGLSPVISIDQKTTARNNPRSTVGTVTEIYDYLRLLFARLGQPHDPDGNPIKKLTTGEIVKEVHKLPQDHRLLILAPVIRNKKGEFAHLADLYQQKGYGRARIDGVVYDLDEVPKLQKQIRHNIDIVVDRVVNSPENKTRIAESVSNSLSLTDGLVVLIDYDDNQREYLFSQKYYNPDQPDFIPPEMEPITFSFNNPQGACPDCTGLGQTNKLDPDLVIPNGNLSIVEGAIRPWNRLRPESWNMKTIQAVAADHNISLTDPTSKLTKREINIVLYGDGRKKYPIKLPGGMTFNAHFNGVIPALEKRYENSTSNYVKSVLERFMVKKACQTCLGKRLKPAVLAVTVGGRSIAEVTALTVDQAQEYVSKLQFDKNELVIAKPISDQLLARLNFLQNVGLNYLTLDRAANSLSGGEAQRIRLATQIGSGLQGVLYILDEPSIGLHQRDQKKLLKTLVSLRDLGNSLFVIEHDDQTIQTADWIVDLGPGAGSQGGQVIAVGEIEEICQNKLSITGRYLSGKESIPYRKKRRVGKKKLSIIGARQNNLKNIDVGIPLGVMVGVCGVSGSGKSTLINDILAKELTVRLNRSVLAVGKHKDLVGVDQLDKVIIIDQSPIGRTPRSNPATYIGLYTDIRNLMTTTKAAALKGLTPGHFSFNVQAGRCEACRGDGSIKKEMHFLPDIFITCQVCQGKRFMPEILTVTYNGLTIADILNLTVAQAWKVFQKRPPIVRKLKTLIDVGLDYLTLGQIAPTLSGGEAQRIKLAKELTKQASGKTIYILDEPTTGLHPADINKLLKVLHTLVNSGNSIVIIEHNLDILKNADWLIELGPEGGEAGGRVVATGTPEDLAQKPDSITGQFLRDKLSA